MTSAAPSAKKAEPQKYLSGLSFEHVWLDIETNPEQKPGEKEPFLLLIDKDTGNVFTLLVYLKLLLDSNYSRKTSQFKNREVKIPEGVAIPAEKKKLVHWKWAEESSSELKDRLKKHVFTERNVESPTGHLMLVVLPVAYIALIHYEEAQSKPLTLAFHRAIRHSTYWQWLPGMENRVELVRTLDHLSGFDAKNDDQKLFDGPKDFIETAKQFMFAFPSEAEKDKYKKGRNQNCPFELDEENHIHALLEIPTQEAAKGKVDGTQLQIPNSSVPTNPTAEHYMVNGSTLSLNATVQEFNKWHDEFKRVVTEFDMGVKSALFVFYQAMLENSPSNELPALLQPSFGRLFGLSERQVAPGMGNMPANVPNGPGPMSLQRQGQGQGPYNSYKAATDYPCYSLLPEPLKTSFRNMVESHSTIPMQRGPQLNPNQMDRHPNRHPNSRRGREHSNSISHKYIDKLSPGASEYLRSRSMTLASGQPTSKGTTVQGGSVTLIPQPLQGGYFPTESLMNNKASQEIEQEMAPKRVKVEHGGELGSGLGSQEEVMNCPAVVKGEDGGVPLNVVDNTTAHDNIVGGGGELDHSNHSNHSNHERSPKRVNSDFEVAKLKADIGIHPFNFSDGHG